MCGNLVFDQLLINVEFEHAYILQFSYRKYEFRLGPENVVATHKQYAAWRNINQKSSYR